MGPAELAILKTVVYADLFDYPLRFDELCAGLFDEALAPDEVRAHLDTSPSLRAVLVERDGFLFLAGRDGSIDARRDAERRTAELLDRYGPVLGRIARLPYVRLLGLSGAAAFENVHDDDLDLFIIARSNRVWSVCLMVTLLSRLFGARRVICANYLLDERSLDLGESDFYTAHQLTHVRPLAGGEVFTGFVRANGWARRHFPNAYDRALAATAPPTRRGPLERLAALGPGVLFELASRLVLTANLRRKIPKNGHPDSVCLESGRLKLHINDHLPTTLRRFERALEVAVERAEGGVALANRGGAVC